MNQRIKIAATKATKLFRAGKLSGPAYQNLLNKIPVKDNLHNRINARALRAAKGQIAKGPMTVKKYLRASKVDNLPSRAPISVSQRTLKHQGRENSRIVGKLKELTGGDTEVFHSQKKGWRGGFSVAEPYPGGEGIYHLISLPPKDTTFPQVSRSLKLSPQTKKTVNRELRGYVARHEIAGEAVTQAKIMRALQNQGLPLSAENLNIFSFGTHKGPDVLDGDRKMVKQLSPAAKNITEKLRKRIPSGNFFWPERGRLKSLSESSQLNYLQAPLDGESLTRRGLKKIRERSYQDAKPFTKKQQESAYMRIGFANRERPRLSGRLAQVLGEGKRPELKDREIMNLAKEYVNTDFWRM